MWAACATPAPFACTDHTDCVLNEQPGLCHDGGQCVYPNAGCESGFAFAIGVPNVGGECVDDVPMHGGTGEPTSPLTTSGQGSTEADTLSVDGDTSTTGAPIACGNGVIEGDEQCDDGNLDNTDQCTIACAPPDCADGYLNQDETGTDCGGVCGACEVCSPCDDRTDCTSGQCDAGTCTIRHQISVDWLEHCSRDGSQTEFIARLPAGEYRATAVLSAATRWSSTQPPEMGWYYLVPCADLGLSQMRTPPGIFYLTPDEAFGNLEQTTETFVHAGGPVRCGVADSVCADNDGQIVFDITALCPGDDGGESGDAPSG